MAETHRTTGRILDTLEILAENSNGYTLSEICKLIGAPKSTMLPILQTLLKRRFLSLDPNSNKYHIGLACFQVGSSYLDNFNVIEEIQNELRNIANVCMETCHFGILVEGEVLYLNKIDSSKPIRMISTIGKKVPAYATAIGKALLIDHDLSELYKLYPGGLKPLTEKTITDFKTLAEQLQKARIDGFTYEIEESNQHIRCLAVPVRKNNQIIAALSVAIPTFRYTEEKYELIKNLLFNAKSKIEMLLKNIEVDFSYFI